MPVFSLEEARALQVKNISQNNFKYWSESAVYGYFGGGQQAPGFICTITRLEFSSETLSNPGKNLPTSLGFQSGVASGLYGYFGGGYFTPVATSYNTISRLDFSNEIMSLPGKNLPGTLWGSASVSSGSYGYFGGGVTGSATSNIRRLDFSSESISLPGKNLSQARYFLAATSSPSYGYFGGGFVPPGVITITRFDFTSETTSDLSSASLPFFTSELSAVSSASYGYFGGGYIPGAPGTIINTITRLDFSNETKSDQGNNLPIARSRPATVSNSSYGYFGGGRVPVPTGSYLCTITRINFTTETISDPGRNFPLITASIGSFSGGQSINRGSKTYGYMIGGYGPGYLSTVSRLDFSTENITNPGKNYPTGIGNFSGAISNNSYGYFGGGYTSPANIRICTITRLDFSNETLNNPGKNLPTINSTCGGVSSNNYGYFGGGFISTNRLCTITRLDFSTENVSNITSTLLGFSIESMATVMNNSYGYFGGGLTVEPFTSVSNITRLDFSNETTNAPATKLPVNNFELAALSSNSYGYFGGGLNPPGGTATNTITRLDFSNDTLSPPGKNLPTAIYRQSTVSSNFYGYFIGGWFPVVNTVSRIDFSNETVSLPGKNNLTPISRSAAFSNSN